MSNIRERVCSVGVLTDAFGSVRRGLQASNQVNDEIEAAELALGEWLGDLAEQLRNGSWEPGSLRRVEIPKPDGSTRTLHIPGVVDRIVERAVVEVVGSLVDARQSPNSYAFRVGTGVADAVQHLVSLRDEGSKWVVRGDIADCFPSLDHAVVLSSLRSFIDDGWLNDLVGRLMDRPQRWHGRFTYTDEGLPQGAPLSPLLCNLYLDAFDRFIARRGRPMIRYADDFTLACDDPDDALEARQLAIEAANRIRKDLAFDKTTVSSFEEGFVFLGQEIGPVLPIVDAQLSHDGGNVYRRSLYVTVPGAGATIRSGQIVVRDNDEDIFAAPISMVDRLVVVGPVGISAGLRNQLLATEVETDFISYKGNWLGRLDNGRPRSSKLVRAQMRAYDNPEERIELARCIVVGKLANQSALLERSLRRDNAADLDTEIERIENAIGTAEDADSIPELMGAEGAGSQAYFLALRSLFPPHAGFTGRNRRPPLDPANAALSYGYAVILGEAVSAMRRAGLEPSLGLLHDDDRSRPSGALDLIEELRPMIVDTVVIEMFRRSMLKPTMFTTDATSGAVMLGDEGKRKLTGAIEERLLTSVTHVPSKTKGSYRRLIVLQARQLAECLIEPGRFYQSQPWR